MKNKRIFTVIMALLLVMSIFTACSDEPEPTNPAVLSNQYFSVTVPDDWVEKIYVEIDEKTISVSQKAAYESFEGGWLFSVSLFEDTMYEELPSYEVISHLWKENDETQNRVDWYLVATYPTDVQADVENEESMREYFDMFEQAPTIIKNNCTFLIDEIS